ncbi:hypothetical protein [Branchiibius cervicis]|uniref:Uncharacterized protein n=1 Tax=Branchiibius cervicis TaxID=908252 RepID=A0ABW2ARS4_9MICO
MIALRVTVSPRGADELCRHRTLGDLELIGQGHPHLLGCRGGAVTQLLGLHPHGVVTELGDDQIVVRAGRLAHGVPGTLVVVGHLR